MKMKEGVFGIKLGFCLDEEEKKTLLVFLRKRMEEGSKVKSF